MTLASRLSGLFKVIGTDTVSMTTYDFLLTLHGPISYRFGVNCDFSRKSEIFPTPVYLTSRL